jgi:hypothetical protein
MNYRTVFEIFELFFSFFFGFSQSFTTTSCRASRRDISDGRLVGLACSGARPPVRLHESGGREGRRRAAGTATRRGGPPMGRFHHKGTNSL